MLLGLDLGTTNVKALVATKSGEIVSSGSAPVKIEHLPDGGVEQDIEDIYSATLSAISGALEHVDVSKIEAIAVSSQGGAMQLQSPEGRPLGRVVSWLDSRGRAYDEKITSELGRDWFVRHTGHGHSATGIGQLLRVQGAGGDLPADFRVGFVGDVIVSRLCGRAAHDRTSLSLAMLYNPSLDEPDPDLLDRLGLSPDRLPDILPAISPAGPLRDEVARRTSLPPGIPVSPAVHDQYAAALGCGAVRPGDVMFGAGTAWVLLAVMDELSPPVIDSAFVCRHPVGGLYGQILSLGNGGSCVSWALETLGLGGSDDAKIDQLMSGVPPGSDGARCVPLFAAGGKGELRNRAGRLDGLKLSHTSAHILRAIVEGLSCELGRYVRFLTDVGLDVRRLLMCGRAAASNVTPQIIANVTGLSVDALAVTDTSALGAAMIARALLEPGTQLADISLEMRPPSRLVKPDCDRDVYAQLLDEYIRNLH